MSRGGTTIVTGGCGFIGSFLVRHLVERERPRRMIVLDKLTYASRGLERLRNLTHRRSDAECSVEIWAWDLTVPMENPMVEEFGDVDMIYHLAAETHVDNSITSPKEAVMNNIGAIIGALELARRFPKLKCFLHFSTDEVYGPCPPGHMAYAETAQLHPSNPYSASKAASELVALSYLTTYGVPVKTVRCMNVVGISQDVEKFLPKLVEAAMTGATIGLHQNSEGTWGSRGYLSAGDAADAAVYVSKHGAVGDVCNVPCSEEMDNKRVLELVGEALQKHILYDAVIYDARRPGHDIRYALDGKKLRELGWTHGTVEMEEYVRDCARTISMQACCPSSTTTGRPGGDVEIADDTPDTHTGRRQTPLLETI